MLRSQRFAMVPLVTAAAYVLLVASLVLVGWNGLRAGSERSWVSWGAGVFVILVCLTLGVLALYRRGTDLRARLVAAFSFLLAVELAIPFDLTGDPRLEVLAYSLFLLVTGIQMAVELHLAAILPTRPAWLVERPWIVPAIYVLGLGAGVVAWGTFLLESSLNAGSASWARLLPWTAADAETALFDVLMPLWAVAVPALLALAARRRPRRRGRMQAGLILLGVLPWSAYVLVGVTAELLGYALPGWVDAGFPLIVLAFPVAVFAAIYRYQLFDIETVVRRSFFYGALTAGLALVFYVSAGVLGLLASKVTGNSALSIWTVSGAMFLVGLAFSRLRRSLRRLVDRLLFPEHQALRRRLIDLAAELPSQGNVTAMGRRLVERLADIFSLQAVSLLLSDPKSGLFFTVASHGPAGEADAFRLSYLVKPDDPVLEALARAGEPLPAARLLDRSPVLAQRLQPLEAQLLVPLSSSTLVGVLVLGRRQGRLGFSREARDLLSLISHQVATVFENIRLFESATFESLTGLRRREAILELLGTEIERANRHGRPLVVGMADLDAFKAVNDRYGHLAGDMVLKRVAEELTSGLRTTDAVGRYGGEEFLLVFPETRLEGGVAVAEKLRLQVDRLRLPMEDGSRVEPKISIGLAELGQVESGPDVVRRLIDRADRALYRAKARGRNRVECRLDDEESDEEPSESRGELRA